MNNKAPNFEIPQTMCEVKISDIPISSEAINYFIGMKLNTIEDVVCAYNDNNNISQDYYFEVKKWIINTLLGLSPQ